MNAQPEYFGDKPAAGGVVIRCGCGNLATHQAMYMVDDGSVGRWRRDHVCETCARDRAVSPDPPRRVEPLPAWTAHEARVRKWQRDTEAKALAAGQQSWDM